MRHERHFMTPLPSGSWTRSPTAACRSETARRFLAERQESASKGEDSEQGLELLHGGPAHLRLVVPANAGTHNPSGCNCRQNSPKITATFSYPTDRVWVPAFRWGHEGVISTPVPRTASARHHRHEQHVGVRAPGLANHATASPYPPWRPCRLRHLGRRRAAALHRPCDRSSGLPRCRVDLSAATVVAAAGEVGGLATGYGMFGRSVWDKTARPRAFAEIEPCC